MRVSLSTVLTAALGLASSSDALKILMGNDDGFGSGNLRELYKLLKDAGHEGELLCTPHSTIYSLLTTFSPRSCTRTAAVRQGRYRHLGRKRQPHRLLPVRHRARRLSSCWPRPLRRRHLVL